jgi:Fe-Mn family superoxide dismutase
MHRATLPELPYSYDALEPYYDTRTVTLHHSKHHAGYVNGFNATLDAIEKARAAADYGAITALERQLAFHGGGHALHSVFWTNLMPDGGDRPSGKLADAIAREFGSYEIFDAQLRAAAAGIQGSGWGILAVEAGTGALAVLAIENHQNQVIPGWVPILVIDVWEHAFYLKYENRKAEWIGAVLEHLVNWQDVARRFEKATAA